MTCNKILVIEDEPAISDLLRMNLEAVGYEVSAAFEGEEAKRIIIRDGLEIDLALVDIMLPGVDGFDLIQELNEKGIPGIFLTARGDVASKVRGLKLSAEDYVVKPFEMLELLARIENVLKRRRKLKEQIQIDGCVIDISDHKVREDGLEIPLKPMEYDLLLLFFRNRNIAFARDQLLNKVWGDGYAGETRTVDVHIAQLRKKLKVAGRIQTIPKLGYRLEV